MLLGHPTKPIRTEPPNFRTVTARASESGAAWAQAGGDDNMVLWRNGEIGRVSEKKQKVSNDVDLFPQLESSVVSSVYRSPPIEVLRLVPGEMGVRVGRAYRSVSQSHSETQLQNEDSEVSTSPREIR